MRKIHTASTFRVPHILVYVFKYGKVASVYYFLNHHLQYRYTDLISPQFRDVSSLKVLLRVPLQALL